MEEYWITANGHRIAVGDMKLVHLRNTLRLLLKQQRLEREQQNKKAAFITAPYKGSPEEQRKQAEQDYKGE